MPLLDMCKRVLAETGWPVPNGIVSNNDPTAQQIFAIANTELRTLSEQFSWPHLETELTFTTVPGQTVYFFPDNTDFRVLAQQSLFDATQYYQLKGSVSLQEWNYRKYGLLGNLNRTAFRMTYPLGVPAIELDVAPTDARDYVCVYLSKHYALGDDNVTQPLYVKDTDTGRIPENYIEMGVKWRFRRAKGLDFSVEVAEYNSTITTQFSKYKSQAVIPIGGRPFNDYYDYAPGYVRENGFGI